MKKAILGVVVGATVLFIWGSISWMVLPWHNSTIKPLPEETLLLDTMRVVIKEHGLYMFPSGQTPEGGMDQQGWIEKMKRGPSGLMVFIPGGREPAMGKNMLVNFLGNLFAAAVLLLILSSAADRVHSLGGRVGLSAAVGLLVAVMGPVMQWNWFSFPAGFTAVAVFDHVIGSALMGAVLSFFVPKT